MWVKVTKTSDEKTCLITVGNLFDRRGVLWISEKRPPFDTKPSCSDYAPYNGCNSEGDQCLNVERDRKKSVVDHESKVSTKI